MADSTTALLQLIDQETGNNDNTWGDIADANFLKLENAIAGRNSIATTGGTTTLTADQSRPMVQVVTGTLVSTATIVVPATSKTWIFENATTGVFVVHVKTASGLGYFVPKGRRVFLYCDGTNVDVVDAGGSIPIGGTMFYAPASASAPDNFFVMTGAAINRTTYAKLFAVLGTTYGVGDGSTTFNLPNMGDRYMVGYGTLGAVGTFLAQSIQSHTHTATAANDNNTHTHVASFSDTFNVATNTYALNTQGSSVSNAAPMTGFITYGVSLTATPVLTPVTVSDSASTGTQSSNHQHTITVNAAGSTYTRPDSVVMYACIRYQ